MIDNGRAMTDSNEINGWKWTMFAGFIPLAAGIFMFITSKMAVANGDANWSFVIHSLNFGFGDLAAVDPQARRREGLVVFAIQPGVGRVQ